MRVFEVKLSYHSYLHDKGCWAFGSLTLWVARYVVYLRVRSGEMKKIFTMAYFKCHKIFF